MNLCFPSHKNYIIFLIQIQDFLLNYFFNKTKFLFQKIIFLTINSSFFVNLIIIKNNYNQNFLF
jgi:hypothetical protein